MVSAASRSAAIPGREGKAVGVHAQPTRESNRAVQLAVLDSVTNGDPLASPVFNLRPLFTRSDTPQEDSTMGGRDHEDRDLGVEARNRGRATVVPRARRNALSELADWQIPFVCRQRVARYSTVWVLGVSETRAAMSLTGPSSKPRSTARDRRALLSRPASGRRAEGVADLPVLRRSPRVAPVGPRGTGGWVRPRGVGPRGRPWPSGSRRSAKASR